MLKRKREAEDKPEKERRVSLPLAAVVIVLLCLLTGITAIKIHSTYLLADAPTDWNKRQLEKIDRSKTKFKFAVFADTHNSNKAFNRIRKEVENGDYLFAIDIGDMGIDSGLVKARMFINQVSTMKTPVLTAVGNHDIAAGGYGMYEKVYGPRYYSFTVGKCLFIVLDDAEEKSIYKKQMDWFKNELQKAKDYPNTFVFMHVPTFRGRRDLNLPMKYFLKDRKSAEEFRQVCIDNDVEVIFSGHCHTFDYDMWPGDIHYVVTGGGGGRLWDVEEYRGMYHYIEVTVDGLEGSFELQPINQKGLHFAYQYIEEPWAYIYTYASVHYFWLAIPLVVAIGLLTLLAFRRRKEDRSSD